MVKLQTPRNLQHLLWILMLLILSVSPTEGLQRGRKLHAAGICESGYEADGGCVSELGMYIPDEGQLYFSIPEDWSTKALKVGMGMLIGRYAKYEGCVMDLLQQQFTSSCTCNLLCVKATINAIVCETACKKLIRIYSDSEFDPNTSDSGSDSGGSGPGCFPADSLAIMADGSRRRMEGLKVGDMVMTVSNSGHMIPSAIYGFAHHLSKLLYPHITITTAKNQSITATPDHYMFIAVDSKTSWKDRKAIAAGMCVSYYGLIYL
jgi:hypothetical protein